MHYDEQREANCSESDLSGLLNGIRKPCEEEVVELNIKVKMRYQFDSIANSDEPHVYQYGLITCSGKTKQVAKRKIEQKLME